MTIETKKKKNLNKFFYRTRTDIFHQFTTEIFQFFDQTDFFRHWKWTKRDLIEFLHFCRFVLIDKHSTEFFTFVVTKKQHSEYFYSMIHQYKERNFIETMKYFHWWKIRLRRKVWWEANVTLFFTSATDRKHPVRQKQTRCSMICWDQFLSNMFKCLSICNVVVGVFCFIQYKRRKTNLKKRQRQRRKRIFW